MLSELTPCPPGPLGEAALYHRALLSRGVSPFRCGIYACESFESKLFLYDNQTDSIDYANRGVDPPRLALPQSSHF